MQNVSWITRRISNTSCILPSYSKTYMIVALIIIIACVIQTVNIYYHVNNGDPKQQRRFKCRSIWKFSDVTSFYDVDCNNPFLKALVKSPGNTAKMDVCNSFSPLYSRIPFVFQSFKPFQLLNFDELLRTCPQCHHMQVIDGKIYDVPRSTSTDYETRSRSVKTLFKYVIDTFHIPNMEFLFHTGDAVDMRRNVTNPSKCPVFGFGNNRKHAINDTYTDGVVPIPCFSFWDWPEARITRWKKKMISIKKAGDSIPFNKRKNQLFWRGARTGYRTPLVNISGKHPKIMDVSFMDWGRTGLLGLSTHNQYRTLEQHCNYKYLLHLEGNTFSGRIKYLLLCGSAVIFAKIDQWEEFWYHLLKHQENILILHARNETLLLDMMNYLIKNPEQASQIGLNGRDTVLKYLNEQAIICYIRNVLLAYSKLVNYPLTKREKLVVVD